MLMPNFAEATQLAYFEACFPSHLVLEMAYRMTHKGKSLGFGDAWDVTVGDVWLFFGIQMYMLLHPYEGDKEDFWLAALGQSPGDGALAGSCDGSCRVYHNLGRFGISSSRWRKMCMAFSLPIDVASAGQEADPFQPIRRFEREWNQSMIKAISPGRFITVDESMAMWKGRGMPGLMSVPRKPTPLGRESHTAADVDTGAIIFCEMWEGKERMGAKEFIQQWGKNPSKALRCSKPWHGTGRTLILDAGFASVKCAIGLAEHGLFMIGNVKGASSGFPKQLMLDNVLERGCRAMATSTFTTSGGEVFKLLAAADKDKQPMSLLGTACTTVEAPPRERHFTTIRGDGTYHERSATLLQMDIHRKYRDSFNVIDMNNNSKRQAGHSFEETWKTHQWWVRDFQMLFGMSEVNAYLCYRRFKPGQADVRQHDFRSRLTFQLLNHPTVLAEKEARRLRAGGASEMEHQPAFNGRTGATNQYKKGKCRYCGNQCVMHCTCAPPNGVSGQPMCICSTSQNPNCFADHVRGIIPANKKSSAMAKIWRESGRGVGLRAPMN